MEHNGRNEGPNSYRIQDSIDGISGNEKTPLQNYLNFLTRYRVLIFLVTVCVVIATSALSIITPKKYRSIASFVIESFSPNMPDSNVQGSIHDRTTLDSYMTNLIPLIDSTKVVDKILSSNGVGEEIRNYLKKFHNEELEKKSKEVGYNNSSRMIEEYLALVDVLRIKKTSYVNLAVTTKDPVLSAKIANFHVETFIKLAEEELHDTSKKNITELENQAQELNNKILQIESDLLNKIEKSNLSNIDFNYLFSTLRPADRDNIILSETLTRQLANRTSDSAAVKAKIESAKKSEDYSSLNMKENIFLNNSRTDLARLKGERQELLMVFGTNHYKVKAIDAKISKIDAEIEREKNNIEKIIDLSAESTVKSLGEINKSIDEVKKERFNEYKLRTDLNSLVREYNTVQKLYQSVQKNLKEAKIITTSAINNIKFSSPALPPSRHVSPNTFFNILLSILLGPVLGIGIAACLYLLDDTFEDSNDVRKCLGLPILGIVPSLLYSPRSFIEEVRIALGMPVKDKMASFKSKLQATQNLSTSFTSSSFSSPKSETLRTSSSIDAQSSSANYDFEDQDSESTNGLEQSSLYGDSNSGDNTNQEEAFTDISDSRVEKLRKVLANANPNTTLVTIIDPLSEASEAFKSIRTTVNFTKNKRPTKLILITSSQQGDGKSTVSTNLAASIAQSSSSTLLIEADLRRPSCAEILGCDPNSEGLADFLSSDIPIEDIIKKTDINNLSVILAGSPVINPTELLSSRKMQELLEMMSAQYSMVIVDAPPVLPVADSQILARLVESIVLVIRMGKTPRRMASEALYRLEEVGGNILGAVLNDVKVDRYSHRSSKYYELIEEEDSEPMQEPYEQPQESA